MFSADRGRTWYEVDEVVVRDVDGVRSVEFRYRGRAVGGWGRRKEV